MTTETQGCKDCKTISTAAEGTLATAVAAAAATAAALVAASTELGVATAADSSYCPL